MSTLEAAARMREKEKEGLCVRLTAEDFEEDVDLEPEMDRILDAVRGVGADAIDLVLDLDLGPDVRPGDARCSMDSFNGSRKATWRRTPF